MNPLNMGGLSIFRLGALCCLSLYLLGLLNSYLSDRKDHCEMTYMFEYPQFVRIALLNNKYPQYGLYAYAEGRLTEKARKMKFDGIPVLFLPGNSGSHMQVRSLASVALRKALSDTYDYHFDYFTVSFNEDLSALFGGVIHHETSFTIDCIETILGLYRYNKYINTVPTNVILIGHSMGGVIAKRLLAYSETINVTNIAIALASPLQAPVVNTDENMHYFYKLIDREWEGVNADESVRDRKMLLSFGNGARDTLMPAGLTYSRDCDIHALTTAIPGVWVSPDHVSIVWCKQLVLAINRFLFSIVDPQTKQVVEDKKLLMARARQYFQANRSMSLSPNITRATVTMVPDGFWYEDNRRVYQISRPEITKMTYLMIRLVKFPQNRFVAIESVNVDDRDWIFGCSAHDTYGTHRYCKQATSLAELSRWSGAAEGAGRRKLATIHLNELAKREKAWTHVVVKVSPTRKPIVLNVDINDLASRQIIVDLPLCVSFGRTVIQQQTGPNSLYYELILPGFVKIHEAFMLHVEPTASCQANEYHVTAEMHVPWAPNFEYFHYFTHAKRSPMKLRLFKSHPYIIFGASNITQHAKVTLLLDPQCSFTISISYSWYHRLASIARNYSPILISYMAAALLLAARASLKNLGPSGEFLPLHTALASKTLKPYAALWPSSAAWIMVSTPAVTAASQWLFSSKDAEISDVLWSAVMLPIYLAAIGLLNVLVVAVMIVMVFSSQIVDRMFYRLLWRGRPALIEQAADGIKRIPFVVSMILTSSIPCGCGAASMAMGGIYYAYLLSNMCQEYLEDYAYKLLAKAAARFFCAFKSQKPQQTPKPNQSLKLPAIRDQEFPVEELNLPAVRDQESPVEEVKLPAIRDQESPVEEINPSEPKGITSVLVRRNSKGKKTGETTKDVALKEDMSVPSRAKTSSAKIRGEKREEAKEQARKESSEPVDHPEGPVDIHFHMTMFFLWMVVTLINVPALITWARNYQYNRILHPDPSCYPAILMTLSAVVLWQLERPVATLKYRDWVSNFLLYLAIFLLTYGPLALVLVNYGVAFAIAVLTLQQMYSNALIMNYMGYKQNTDISVEQDPTTSEHNTQDTEEEGNSGDKENVSDEEKHSEGSGNAQSPSDGVASEGNNDDERKEKERIYAMLKTLREKFAATEEM